MSGEFAQLIEEPAGGVNHGRRASENPDVEGRHLPLGTDDLAATEYVRAGGWSIVTDVPGTESRGGGWQRSGGTTHRGVLHPDEHVDVQALRVLVERELGFTYIEVRSVYRQGRLTDDRRELRGRIDARLLEVARAGGNMAELGRALGFPIKDDGHCRVLENALTRARKENR